MTTASLGLARSLSVSLSRFWATIRRSHAMEHATVHILAEHLPTLRVVGRTTHGGFYLYGDIDTASLKEAVQGAVGRLKSDADLAVHPRCGTNLAVTAVVAGLAAFAAGSVRTRSRLATLPQVLLASLWGVLLAQPLGYMVQKELTTSARVEGARIGPIIRSQVGRVIVHFVPLTWG